MSPIVTDPEPLARSATLMIPLESDHGLVELCPQLRRSSECVREGLTHSGAKQGRLESGPIRESISVTTESVCALKVEQGDARIGDLEIIRVEVPVA